MVKPTDGLSRGKHIFLSIYFLLLLLTASQSAFSQSKTLLKLSPTIVYFYYQEFDTNDLQLNRENGNLYGLSTELKYKRAKYELSASASFLSGTVGYSGKTNKGKKASTNTSERINNFNTSISIDLFHTKKYVLATSILLGYRHWTRNIKSNQYAAGPLEYYRWYYLGTGLSASTTFKNNYNLTTKLNILLSPASEIEFNIPNYDSVKAELGFTRGVKLNVNLLDNQTNFGLFFYYERWHIARNKAIPLSQNGKRTNVLVTEPKSITQVIGAGVFYQFE